MFGETHKLSFALVLVILKKTAREYVALKGPSLKYENHV